MKAKYEMVKSVQSALCVVKTWGPHGLSIVSSPETLPPSSEEGSWSCCIVISSKLEHSLLERELFVHPSGKDQIFEDSQGPFSRSYTVAVAENRRLSD